MALLHSIRARMTLGVSFSIGTLLLLSSWALVGNARRTAERNADSLLTVAARKVEREWNTNAAHEDIGEMMADQRDFASENLAMMIVDGQGKVLQKSSNILPTWPRRRKDGWRVRIVRVGEEIAVIGYHWRQTEQALKEQAIVLGILSLIVFVAGTAGAWLLVGRTLSPISRLAQQAEAASIDSLHVQLYTPSEDVEMVQLVQTLNGLLARQAQAAAARERFYAAASHELRTPLQALLGHLGLALMRPRQIEEYQTVVREAKEQTRRLNSLVSDLLVLNQLDTAQIPPRQAVGLAPLCRRTLAEYAPLIQARSLTVHTDYDVESVLDAPSTHADMLVRNLIENALKYAAPAGSVHLILSSGRLTILNSFDPSLPWEPDRLFEPFHRPDTSRNSATGGNGLGLAICKAIADTNGWTLTLRQTAGQVECSVLFSNVEQLLTAGTDPTCQHGEAMKWPRERGHENTVAILKRNGGKNNL